jgi:hypothetical protein
VAARAVGGAGAAAWALALADGGRALRVAVWPAHYLNDAPLMAAARVPGRSSATSTGTRRIRAHLPGMALVAWALDRGGADWRGCVAEIASAASVRKAIAVREVAADACPSRGSLRGARAGRDHPAASSATRSSPALA